QTPGGPKMLVDPPGVYLVSHVSPAGPAPPVKFSAVCPVPPRSGAPSSLMSDPRRTSVKQFVYWLSLKSNGSGGQGGGGAQAVPVKPRVSASAARESSRQKWMVMTRTSLRQGGQRAFATSARLIRRAAAIMGQSRARGKSFRTRRVARSLLNGMTGGPGSSPEPP